MIRFLTPALLAAAVVALAGSAGAEPDQHLADICLDPAGHAEAPACNAMGGRTRVTEGVCVCPSGTMKVVAPFCPDGVKPPPESLAYDRARKAAAQDGSLVGDLFEGAPMCVAPPKM